MKSSMNWIVLYKLQTFDFLAALPDLVLENFSFSRLYFSFSRFHTSLQVLSEKMDL